MSKKTFYIILIVMVVLITMGLLIWYFTLKPIKAPAPISNINFTTPGQNLGGTKLQTISEEPAVSLHQTGDAIMFYGFSGRLWQFNIGDLKPVLLDQTPIENMADVIWSANAKNIVKSGIGQIDSFYTLSDTAQKSLFNLKTDTKTAAFSPDGKKIVYQMISNSVNNSLLTSDSSGKNQKTLIRDFKLRDIILNWISNNNIAIISKPSGTVAGSLWFLDLRNLNINKIIDNLFGLEALFSPNGSSFIYSYTDSNGRNLKLAVYDKKGGQKNINNISTPVDKCAWLKDMINIYCAVPKSWPDFAVLPDDYYKNAFSTNDDVWKINTETGEKTLITENIGDATNLAVSEDESSLFFISKENQFLYKLNLR